MIRRPPISTPTATLLPSTTLFRPRPFSVAAAGKIVVATGTEFSVELLGRETRVILYEGHVAVLNGSAATRDTLKLFDKKPAPRSDYLIDRKSTRLNSSH